MDAFNRLIKILPNERKYTLSTELVKLLDAHNYECFVCCKKLNLMNTIVSYKMFDECGCGSSIKFACMRCADEYLQFNKVNRTISVKHPICSERLLISSLVKDTAYIVETELMEQLDKLYKDVVLTCECGMTFTSRIKIRKHVEKDCNENYKSCPALGCIFHDKIKYFVKHLIQDH